VIGPYAGNRVALIEKIAADDFAVHLRNHHGIEARVGKHHRYHAGRDLDTRKVPREIVLTGNRLEGLEIDEAACGGIFNCSAPEVDLHFPFPPPLV
jgi:hypothetical protein